MAEPIGIWTRVDPTCQAGVHTSASWRIPMNRPCAAAMCLLLNYFDHSSVPSNTGLSASSVQTLLEQTALLDNWLLSLLLSALLSVQFARHGNGRMCQQQTLM